MSELDDEFAEYADDPELLEMMKAERELSKKAALEAEQKNGTADDELDGLEVDEAALMKELEDEVGGDDEALLIKMMEEEANGAKTADDDEFAEFADDPELLAMMKAEKELSKKAAAEKAGGDDDDLAEYADDPELLAMMKAEKELSKKAAAEKNEEDEFAEYADDPELLAMMKAEKELSKKAAAEKAEVDEFAEYADDPELLAMMKAEKELSKKAAAEKGDDDEFADDPELAEMMKAEKELSKKAAAEKGDDDEFADDPELLAMMKAEKELSKKAAAEKAEEDEFAEYADDPELLAMMKAEKELSKKAAAEKAEVDEFAEYADDPELLAMMKAEKELSKKAAEKKGAAEEDEFAEFADDPEMLAMLKAEKELAEKAKAAKNKPAAEEDEFAEYADDPEMLAMLKAEKELAEKAKAAKSSAGDDEDPELAEMMRQEQEMLEKAKSAKSKAGDDDDDPELQEMLRQEKLMQDKAKASKAAAAGDDDDTIRQMEEELAALAASKKAPPMKRPDNDDDEDDGTPMVRASAPRGGGPPQRGGRGPQPPPQKAAPPEDDEDDGAPMVRASAPRGGGPSRGGPTRGTPAPQPVPQPEPETIPEPPELSGFDLLRQNLAQLAAEEEESRRRRQEEEEEEIRRQFMPSHKRESPNKGFVGFAMEPGLPEPEEPNDDDLLAEFDDNHWKGADVQLTEWETVMGTEGFTLEDLLGMQCDFISVLQNERVLYPAFYDYFIQPTVVQQLLAYILDSTKDNTLGGAALAVLTANLSEINVLIVKSHLPSIYKFYEGTGRVNTLRANALTKIFKTLLNSSELTKFVASLKPPHITSNMLNHSYCPFIGEFFVALATNADKGTIAQRLLVSVKYIENCLTLLENEDNAHVHAVLADHLKELVDVLPFDSPLMQSLATAGNVGRLFQTTLSNGVSQSKYGPQVYLHVLATYIKKLQEMAETRPPLDSAIDTIHPLIKEPVKNFDRMVARLAIGENCAQIEDLAHNFNYVFGYARLHVLDMVDLLLQSDFYVVIDTLMDPSVNFFPVALQCIQDFSHSTFCHKFVESIFQQCFVAQPADIILKILQSVNFPAEIIAIEAKSKEQQASTGYPLQYMSYLRNIAYALQKILTIADDPNLLDHIELTPGWPEYVTEINEIKERANRGADRPLADPNAAAQPHEVKADELDESSLDDMLAEFADPK